MEENGRKMRILTRDQEGNIIDRKEVFDESGRNYQN